jgi:hypothetical protein
MKNLVLPWALLFWFMGNGDFLGAADTNWRAGFDRICARTADAGKLSSEELGRLIVESDELLEIVAASGDPEGKIYLLRLTKCRDFFVFMRQAVNNSRE